MQGANCPNDQGVCLMQNYCMCINGYHTLLDQNVPGASQTYCNYKKISVYVPVILEIFFPSVGHFVVGKYWMGLIKLSSYNFPNIILFGK